jgi:hypothetical protein
LIILMFHIISTTGIELQLPAAILLEGACNLSRNLNRNP